MSDEEPLSDLFAQFDEVVEHGPKPLAQGGDHYTRSRTPNVGTRLLRWAVQGPGLLYLYMCLFLASVATSREVIALAMGIGLVGWLAAPLLGRRALAEPRRWAGAVLFATLLLMGLNTLARWLILLSDSLSAPLTALAIGWCTVVERATEPAVAIFNLFLAGALLWLGRRLAAQNPWLETVRKPRAWRRTVALVAVGFVANAAVALPLAHHVLWSQSWLGEARRSPNPWAREPEWTREGDLKELLSPILKTEGRQMHSVVRHSSRATYLSAVRVAKEYLNRLDALTDGDLNMIAMLLNRSSDESPDADLNEFVWQVKRRVATQELRGYRAMTADRAFREHLLPMLCQMESTAANLLAWEKRAAELPPSAAVRREDVDAAMLRRIQTYRPYHREQGRFTRVGSTGDAAPLTTEYQQPLRLFGVPMPFSPADVADQMEQTAVLLVYSHRRQAFQQANADLPSLLAGPYTGAHLFDDAIGNGLFAAVHRDLPYRGTATSDKLLKVILKLKAEKVTQGAFPASYPGLPEGITYQSSGKTARLFTESFGRNHVQHFDGTLR